jgi:hypothetical protein
VSYGEDFETAQKQAADALGLHIYGMEKDSLFLLFPFPFTLFPLKIQSQKPPEITEGFEFSFWYISSLSS